MPYKQVKMLIPNKIQIKKFGIFQKQKILNINTFKSGIALEYLFNLVNLQYSSLTMNKNIPKMIKNEVSEKIVEPTKSAIKIEPEIDLVSDSDFFINFLEVKGINFWQHFRNLENHLDCFFQNIL